MSQAPPRPARPFFLEGILGAFALYSLVSGFLRGEVISIFWGVITLCGLVILYFVRRKNWQEHWNNAADSTGHDTLPRHD